MYMYVIQRRDLINVLKKYMYKTPVFDVSIMQHNNSDAFSAK